MRRSIDTAPRDGENISINDVAGAVEAGHWSAEAGGWVGKDGSPIGFAPTHWCPGDPETEYVDPEDEKSGSSLAAAVVLVPLIFVGMALLGAFDPFKAQTVPEMTRIDGESAVGLDQRPEIATGSPAFLQRETTGALMLAVPASTVGPGEGLDADARRSDALSGELAGARRELDEAVQRTQTAEIAAEELRQALQQEQARSAASANELAGARREIETRIAQARNADELAAQQRDAAAREIAELQQSLQQEREKSAVLAKQASAAQAARASSEQERYEAQSRAAALASELAGIPRGSLTADGAAAEQSEAAGREIAELRQSLQQERERNVAQQENAARSATVNAEQQRRALEEAQAHAAALEGELAETRRDIEILNGQLREANDAASQQRQAANREIAELRQSLQQERSRTEARERDFASGSRLTDEHAPVEQKNEGPILSTAQNVIAAEPPMSPGQDEVEARLIPRARALLDQGNIGAARIVLELAAEKNIAQATFMLAETYDPAVLSAWGAYGTRGEAAKARELYAKAQRSGIREAKERLDAMHH
ncbi:chemotaxis protein histidine kinase CheA [Bradyrhizobium sp. USDA 4354]